MRLDFEAILGLLFFVVFIVLPLVRGSKKAGQNQQPGQQRPGQPPGAPGQPTASGRPLASGQAPSSTAGGNASGRPLLSQGAPRTPTATATPPQGAPAPDSLMSTIEEIRRRVREAQEREEAARRGTAQASTQPSSSQQQGSLVGSDAFQSTLVSAPERKLSGAAVQRGPSGTQQPTRQMPSSLVQQGQRTPPPSPLGREGVTSDPMRVERLQPVKPSVKPTRKDAEGRPSAYARGQRRGGALPATIGAASLLAADRDAIMRGLIWHEVLSEPMVLRRRKRGARAT